MNIWIMRHGEAGFNHTTDAERSLTAFGTEMAQKQGLWLTKRWQQLGIFPDKILVSPYLRTQQTLQAITKAQTHSDNVALFQSPQIIETWQGITPAANPHNVVNYLQFLKDEGAKNILMISHLPLVYDLAQQLTQNEAHVHFYPAVIAEIDWTGTKGTLITVENPNQK